MHHSASLRRLLSLTTALAAAIFTASSVQSQVIDDAATRGIWKLKYGVQVPNAQLTDPSWANQDADGDGQTNGEEIAAGTNPFNAGKVIKISSLTRVNSNVNLVFPTELGKRYRVESTTTISNPNSWAGYPQPTPAEVAGDGMAQTLTVPFVGGTFFRVRVFDVDSDLDGVADWAEQAVTLNPNQAETVPGVNDLAYVTEQIAIPPTVTITPSTPFASEDGLVAGKVTITRSQNLFPITVSYGLGGTASQLTDYLAPTQTTVNFPARGALSQEVFINPRGPRGPVGSKSVIVTLNPSNAGPGEYAYNLGSPSSATVIVNPSTVASGTGLLARYYDTSSSIQADAANFGQLSDGPFVYTRNGASSPFNGSSIVVPTDYAGSPAILAGTQVRLSFNGGGLDGSTFDNQVYTVSAVSPGVSFTVPISGSGLSTIGSYANQTCSFALAGAVHPPVLERVDSTVNFEWQFGTPNGAVILPNNSADNYSTVFETYLHPATAGSYRFQLDADDRARVLLDTGSGLQQIVEHNWTNPGADPVGTFKISTAIPLVVPASPAQRYRLRVEHVETTGDARCRLQWSLDGAGFANIPSAQQNSPQAMNYQMVGQTSAVIIPTGGHSFSNGAQVSLVFAGGVLSTPGFGQTYSQTYTIASVAGSGVVSLPGSSTTLNSNVVNVPSTAGLAVGMAISGTGLPANQFITAIDSGANTVTVSTGTGVTAQASTTLTATSTFTVPITPFTISLPGSITRAANNAVTVASTAGLAAGMPITGTGLPAGVTISSIVHPTPYTPGLIYLSTATGVTAQSNTTLTAALPSAGTVTGSGFIQNVSSPTANGVLNLTYGNTNFSGSPGRVAVDSAVTTGNGGLWNAGSPDGALFQPDSFSARWTGQVQPQFSEDYTFSIVADDGCALWINGQPQVLRQMPSALTGGANYTYDAASGNLTINYAGATIVPNSIVAGETVRIEPTAGALNHAPATSPTYSYDPGTGDIVVDYTNLTNRPANSYTVGEVVEIDPVNGSLSALNNAPYAITAATANTFTVKAPLLTFTPTLGITEIAAGTPCTITTAQNHGFSTGNQVRVAGVTSGTFGAPVNAIYTLTVVDARRFTIPVNCTGAPTKGQGTVNLCGNMGINDTRNAVVLASPAPTATSFTVNIGANKYASVTTAAAMNIETVNRSLKEWVSNGNERYVRVPMVGGVRYDIQLDMFEAGGASRAILSWFSPSQPRQVIPRERLYPSSAPLAPPAHTSPTHEVALVGGTYTYGLAGSNAANVTIVSMPAWLTYNAATGIVSGVPPAGAAGDYQIVFNLTTATGTSSSVLNLRVAETPGHATREVWTGIAGTNVSSIPTSTTPATTENATSLSTAPGALENYGERLRGFITAPATGNYYFWVAANDSAELWISNDDDPINAFKRAWVTGAPGGTPNYAFSPTQKSAWLALEQGKKYYFEVLHKSGSGSGDHLAVGWARPGELSSAPSEVVPGYALSPFVAAPPATPGTLYVATMLTQPGAVPPAGGTLNGVGSSTLRVSEDGTYAVMRRSYSGLTGGNTITAEHIHCDPFNGKPSKILFDIDEPDAAQLQAGGGPQPDGSYKWVFIPVSPYSVDEIKEMVKQGKAYINLHTALNPDGEIRGNYTLANGTRTFTPPPAMASWSDDSNTDNGAARFLAQATFGMNMADIAGLKALAPTGGNGSSIPPSRYRTWIENQFNLATSQHLPEVLAREVGDAFGAFDTRLSFNTWWRTSVTAPDQLRQRAAFALSQIHVVSGQGPLEDNARAISHFYDTLLANAFGNFRNVLVGTTLTPGMGRYLDMLRNDKPDLATGRIPNENYAREIKQLFSIGLFRMWPDGSLMLSSKDSPIDTYSQLEIVGLSNVFTGWDYGYDGGDLSGFGAPADWTRPMRVVPARHFTGPKRVLNNEVLPGLTSVSGQPLDPYASHLSMQFNDTAYRNLADEEFNYVHDMLFNHANTGPFICRQMIQRMVTSSPSRDYIYRVVQAFNGERNVDGVATGVRGDMKEVIRAILLDYEARSPLQLSVPAYGKQREPVLRVSGAARAFRPSSNVGGTYSQSGTNVITISTGTTPHRLVSGASVFLEFTDGTPGGQTAPTAGIYTVQSVPSATSFTINAAGWITGTYTQSGNTVTINSNNHWVPGNGRLYIDFTTGGLSQTAAIGGVSSQVFDGVRNVVTSTSTDLPSGPTGNVPGTTFTIAGPDTLTAGQSRTGNLMIARFGGSYAGFDGRTITIDTAYVAPSGANSYGTQAAHGLRTGDNVFLNFTNSRDTTSGNPSSTVNDKTYAIAAVPDENTFVVATSGTDGRERIQSDNQVFIFPEVPQPLTRNGTVAARIGTFRMDNTDVDLAQTPLNSPTVFNFFLPDFKFPGTLASQGITTPEFELTAETTVIRQSNYFFNAIFNPASSSSMLSGFYGPNTGNVNDLALIMDFTPWMGATATDTLGNGQDTAQPWTNDINLHELIDRLNTLLMAGQLPAAARDRIYTFLTASASPSISSIPVNNPVLVNTSQNHGLSTGAVVTINGVTGGTFRNLTNTADLPINTQHTVTVTSPTQFRIDNIRCTTAPNAGQLTGALASGTVPYNNNTPTDFHKRERLRAIVHLILTSPDFAIQR